MEENEKGAFLDIKYVKLYNELLRKPKEKGRVFMSNYRKKSYKKQQKEKQNRMMIPLMMVPFISLLVRAYQYDTKLGDQTWFAGDEHIDVFFLFFSLVSRRSLSWVSSTTSYTC